MSSSLPLQLSPLYLQSVILMYHVARTSNALVTMSSAEIQDMSSSQPRSLKGSRPSRSDKRSRELSHDQDPATPRYVSCPENHTNMACQCHYDGDYPTDSRTAPCDDLDGLHREDFVLFPSYSDPYPRHHDAPRSSYNVASPSLPSHRHVVLYGGNSPQSAPSSTLTSSRAQNVLRRETATSHSPANSSRRRRHRGHSNTSTETSSSSYVHQTGSVSSSRGRYPQEAKVYYPPSPPPTPRVQRLSTPDFADFVDEYDDDDGYIIEPGYTVSYSGVRRTTMDRNCQCCPFLSLALLSSPT